MTLQAKFTEKYGISPLKLVEDAHIDNLGSIKRNGLITALEYYIDKEKLNIEVTSEFQKDLVEAFAEAGERFPESGKTSSMEANVLLSIPSVNPSVPKSKGTLENFKEIVGKDELRPIMSGVFVSEDGASLVGTDAHKLVVQKTNEYSENAGKIIDLTVYNLSKGKKLTFIDGKYPNYNAVIPRDNPNEVKNFDTYALYNFSKSAIAVHKLIEQTLFNINLELPNFSSNETIIASFNPVIAADLLSFALVNGWNKFTLEYSEPYRAFIMNFGDGNIGLLMPILNREGSEIIKRGAEILTPEEIMDKYKFAGKVKSVKPAATKPARPSAPVSSEPFKEFKGEYDEENTTYVLRRDIESITLTNGEVLGKNDVVQGFYRVKKKMAHGGGLDGELKSFQVKVFISPNPQTPVEETVVLKPTKSLATLYVEDYLEPNWISKYGDKYLGFEILTQKMEHGGSMYAKGGGVGSIVNMNNWKVIDRDRDLEKMKKICDTIRKMGYESTIVKQNNVYVVLQESEKESEFRQVYARGGEIKVGDKVIWRGNEYTFSKISNNSVAGMIDEKYHLHSYKKNVSDAILDSLKDVKKMAHGGSMYADGGNMFEKPIAMYREVSGKTRNLPQSTEVYESEINRFIDYVHDFYEEQGYTKAQVKTAVNKYLRDLDKQFTYGGGDSLDRERVYEYLLNPSLNEIKNPSLGIISSTSSDFEVGDSVYYEPEYNPKLDKGVEKLFNRYANRELVIEEIEFDTPFNTAKSLDKASGRKLSFDLVLNPEYIKKYAHGGSMYAGGGYIRPDSDTRVSGKYDFKTNSGLGYELLVVGYERKNDDSDSLYFDDLENTAKKELGSIIIKNNSWKNLSKGQPIVAISETGIKGRLTRIGNLYAHGGSMYAGGGGVDGGRIPNNYKNKNKTESEIWQNWTSDQKYTFLYDHCQNIGINEKFYNESRKTTKPKKASNGEDIGFMYIDIDKIVNTKSSELPRYVKFELQHHVREGQYAHGGSMYAGGGMMGRVKVGTFNEAQLKSGEDKLAIEKAQKETGLTYIDSKITKKGGKMFMEVYLIPTEEYLKSAKFENGGSMTSGHEVGDTVTFNSVMGGTKTGTIISKMGEEGFRIQVGNGFATVKKSAIV